MDLKKGRDITMASPKSGDFQIDNMKKAEPVHGLGFLIAFRWYWFP